MEQDSQKSATKHKVYKDSIQPKVLELRALCEELKVPCIMTFHTEADEGDQCMETVTSYWDEAYHVPLVYHLVMRILTGELPMTPLLFGMMAPGLEILEVPEGVNPYKDETEKIH